ncbi:MAG TPA: hypothetical protein VIK25_12765 [Gemmatimonadaceae bacterium]
MFVPVSVTGTTLAATVELLKGMSAYSEAVAPPRQSDAFCAAVSATTSPTDSCRAVALEHNWAVLVTVTSAVPDLPSLVAVMVAVPGATPRAVRTAPVVDPDTMAVLLDDQENVRPVSAFPLASRGVAVRTTVLPATTLAETGKIVTVATDASVTVTAAVPDLPSFVAVIVELPTATAVTSPLAVTVAFVASELLHVIVRPERTLPPPSRTVAVNCCVKLTDIEAVEGVTATDATGFPRTVMVEEPFLPSLDAVMVALPAAMAVTRPLDDTEALVASDELQVTVRPVNVALPASRVVAVSCCVAPTRMLAVAGDTVTLATGTGMTVRVDCPDLIPAAAVMVVCPAATAVIAPSAETEATAGDEDDQVTAPTLIDAPFWSAPEALAVAD